MALESKMRSQINKGVSNLISRRKGPLKNQSAAAPLLKHAFMTQLGLVPTTLHDRPSPNRNRGVAFRGGESAPYVPRRTPHWYEDYCTIGAQREAEAQSRAEAARKTTLKEAAALRRKPAAVRSRPAALRSRPEALRSRPAAVHSKPAAVLSKPAAVRSKARGTRLPKEPRRTALTEQFQSGFPKTSPGGFYAIPKSWPDVRSIFPVGTAPSGVEAGVTSLQPWLDNTNEDVLVPTVADKPSRVKRERKQRATKISAHTIIRHNGIMIGYMKNAYEPTNMVATAVAPRKQGRPRLTSSSKPREEVYVDIMYAQLGDAEPFRAQTPGTLNIPPKVQQIFDSQFALPPLSPFAAAPVDLGGLVLSTYIPEAHNQVEKPKRKPRTAKATKKTVTETDASLGSAKKRATKAEGKDPSGVEQSIQSVRAKQRAAKKESENISLQEQLTHLANLQKRAAKRMNEDTSRKDQMMHLVRAKKRAAKRAADDRSSMEESTTFVDLASETTQSGESEVSYLLQCSLSQLSGGGRSPYGQSQPAPHGRYAFGQPRSSPHSLAGFGQSQSIPDSRFAFSPSQSVPDSQASFSQSQSSSNCSGSNPEQGPLSREQAYHPYGEYPRMPGGYGAGAGWNEGYGAQQQRQWLADQQPPWVTTPSASSPQLGRRLRAQPTPVHGYYKQQASSQMAQAGSQMAQFSSLLKRDPDTPNKTGINPSAIMNQQARDFQHRFNQSQAEYTSRLRKNHDIFNALSSECALVLDQRRDSSSQQRDSLSQQGESSSQQRDSSSQLRDVLCQQRDVPCQQRNVPCHQSDVSSQQRDVSCQRRDSLGQQRDSSSQQSDSSSQQRVVPCQQRNFSCQRRDVLCQQRDVLCQQRDGLSQQRDSSSQQRDVQCQQRDVPHQQRDVPCQRINVSSQQRDVSCQRRDILSVPCQQRHVLSQRGDVLGQQSDVSSLQRDVKSLARRDPTIDDVGRKTSESSDAKSPTTRIKAEGE